ncbi:MAG: beta-ketoacyl synthase [Desulfuromonas sp.]|nr:MAG: beta-ketoacyl synthase [Desulfuromonas sp.]
MKARILGIGWVDGDGPGKGRGPRDCNLRSGELPRIERSDIFSNPDRRFGRLDDFSRLGLAAIALALQDAGLDTWEQKRPWAIIAASRYGCLATDHSFFDTVIPEGGALASPNLFAYTLSNCFTGEAAIRFGLTGPSYVLGEQGEQGFAALQLALESLADGEAPLAVAGISDLAVDIAEGDGHAHPGAVFMVLATDSTETCNAPLLEGDATKTRIDSMPAGSWNELVAAARNKL